MSEVRQRKPKISEGKKKVQEKDSGGEETDKKYAAPAITKSGMKKLVGFDWSDFTSADRFYRLCHAPTDPSCLALFRLLFGTLMVFDCVHERGLPALLERWSDEFEVCRFPLFNFLNPLPAHWMAILYMLMGLGAAGVALGCFYRISCVMFVIPYWYMFLLDKTHWNNHSYLFGLTGTFLLFCDANRFWSIDAWRNPEKYSNKTIPAWQYALFRYQLIIVYFVAGLKKMDRDWVEGYSMSSLSLQWVFDPFRHIMTDEQIDRYIVHWGGLVMDLTAGFLLYFDPTRWIGAAMSCSFHFMNSRMFKIGQFPYVMICTTMLFYAYDWPKKIFPAKICNKSPAELSSRCVTEKEKPGLYHKFFSCFCVFVVMWQGFMPYSHFITQGYNGWGSGLYGYSWDMMVHNWGIQHVKIRFVSKAANDDGFLDPEAFVSLNRWPSHPDMIKQHATCIAKLLDEEYNIPEAEIYMDIWTSMNKRFKQRMVDPNVDLVKVEWSPFKPASYILPMLIDLEGWRSKLKDIGEQAKMAGGIDTFLENPDATFLADFPGMMLENHLSQDLGKTNLTLLAGGAVLFNPSTQKNQTLVINEPIRLGIGTHRIYVTSDVPACYMYLYSNTTKASLDRQLTDLETQMSLDDVNLDALLEEAVKNETLKQLLDMKEQNDKRREEQRAQYNKTFWESKYDSAYSMYKIVRSSFMVSYSAIETLFTGESMIDVVERNMGKTVYTVRPEDEKNAPTDDLPDAMKVTIGGSEADPLT